MGLGQLLGPSWETGTLFAAPIRCSLSRLRGSTSVMGGPDVCDEKKRKAPPKRILGWPPSEVGMVRTMEHLYL
jgi:hypothetical protein